MSDSWEKIYKEKGEYFKDLDPSVIQAEEIFKKNNIKLVLDFGCGTGRHVLYFARLGYDVHGFDISQTGIEMAQEKLTKEGLSANLRVWDMTKPLPYENEFFDATVSVRVMHHNYISTIESMVKEIYRVIKKGGFLFITVPTYGKMVRLLKEGADSVEVESGTTLPQSGSEKGLPHHNFKKEELLQLLKDFKLYNIYERDEHWNFLGQKL